MFYCYENQVKRRREFERHYEMSCWSNGSKHESMKNLH